MDLGFALRAPDPGPVPEGELPEPRQVNLTRHAVERYRERVRPELSLEQAAGRMRAEMTRRGRVEERMPRWAGAFPGGEAALILPSARAALPLARDDGRWVAVSCLTS
ncbi:MAG: hypothetical protein ACR2NA_12930 [Solirubrobacterales bacterium]